SSEEFGVAVRRLVVTAGKLALRAFPEGVRQAAAVQWRRHFPVGDLIAAEQATDPERLAVLPYCVGRGLDVGCGCAKTTPEAIGGWEIERLDICRPNWSFLCVARKKEVMM